MKSVGIGPRVATPAHQRRTHPQASTRIRSDTDEADQTEPRRNVVGCKGWRVQDLKLGCRAQAAGLRGLGCRLIFRFGASFVAGVGARI